MAWRAWLQTTKGRTYLQWAAIATGLTSFAANFLPQSFCIEYYQKFVQSYTKGLGTPVSPRVTELYEQVLEDMKVPQFERSLLKVFTVYGFDLFHAGSTILQPGAIIGVPVNFSYETEQDVDRRIKVVSNSVDWESPTGSNLRSSLVLSEDARKFCLAREVVVSRGNSVWFYSLYPTCAIIFTYMTSVTINDRLRIRQHPFRFIMYSVVAAFFAALYCAVTDLTTAYVESNADSQAAAVSQKYVKGGVEFYTKLRERNKALRELMGEIGSEVYTSTGNDVVMLRMKTTPISERLLNLQKLLSDVATTSNS